ncbi:hypothetical protein AsAng_0023900 [Aureispira anguillae]|uniref:Uncharacterized protein n=1 Tax=Aureispira anguillae TaxID=2864201 RepID=A0A916DS65_9BACT|nr:hypothetical protein AsAng_0023900 [Aureispira anguillae]
MFRESLDNYFSLKNQLNNRFLVFTLNKNYPYLLLILFNRNTPLINCVATTWFLVF